MSKSPIEKGTVFSEVIPGFENARNRWVQVMDQYPSTDFSMRLRSLPDGQYALTVKQLTPRTMGSRSNPLSKKDFEDAVAGEKDAICDYADMIKKSDTNKEADVLTHIQNEEGEHLTKLRALQNSRYKPAIPKLKINKWNVINGITVWLVDAGSVRTHYDIDFTMGGNHFAPNQEFIPDNEIWIDSELDEREVAYTVLHEVSEMSYRKAGQDYDMAHNMANTVEQKYRTAGLSSADNLRNAINTELKTNPRPPRGNEPRHIWGSPIVLSLPDSKPFDHVCTVCQGAISWKTPHWVHATGLASAARWHVDCFPYINVFLEYKNAASNSWKYFAIIAEYSITVPEMMIIYGPLHKGEGADYSSKYDHCKPTEYHDKIESKLKSGYVLRYANTTKYGGLVNEFINAAMAYRRAHPIHDFNVGSVLKSAFPAMDSISPVDKQSKPEIGLGADVKDATKQPDIEEQTVDEGTHRLEKIASEARVSASDPKSTHYQSPTLDHLMKFRVIHDVVIQLSAGKAAGKYFRIKPGVIRYMDTQNGRLYDVKNRDVSLGIEYVYKTLVLTQEPTSNELDCFTRFMELNEKSA